MNKILLFGAGGHGRVILDIAQCAGFHVVGFLDKNKPTAFMVDGIPILGSEANLRQIVEETGVRKGSICVGDNWIRCKVVAQILNQIPDFEFVSLIHPRAIVAASSVVGCGSVVMAGAVLNPGVVVGEHTIVNTGSCVDHDCKIASYSSLGPGVVMGGGGTVGEFSAIGLGAHVIHGKSIGMHTVIGASSLVTRDIGDHCVAYGVPTKVIRKRGEGEKYL